MRVLTAIGFATEVQPNTYSPNALTHYAVTPGAIGALKHHFDLDMAMAGQLVPYLRRSPDKTFYQFAGEPPEATTLFDFTHGFPTIFGLISSNSDVGREQKEAFEDYMAAKRPSLGSGAGGMKQWFDIYPAGEALKDARRGDGEVLIVDVGGGSGQEIVGLKKRFPELPGRYVLEDLAGTLDTVKDLPAGVEKMPHNFFHEQPVRGARVYFLRDVMHNWSDAKCTEILKRLVVAMDKEYSVVLIDQYVLAETGAELRAAEMDILMLLHTSGIQRTVPMWEKLLGGAGLKIEKIWSAEGAHESVIEARVR